MEPRTITLDDIKELALRHPIRDFSMQSASKSIIAWFVRLNWRKTVRPTAVFAFLDYVGIYRRETYKASSFSALCVERWPLDPKLTKLYDTLRYRMFGTVIAEIIEVFDRFPDQLEEIVVDAMEENRRLARNFQKKDDVEKEYIASNGKGSLLAKAITRYSLKDLISCSSGARMSQSPPSELQPDCPLVQTPVS